MTGESANEKYEKLRRLCDAAATLSEQGADVSMVSREALAEASGLTPGQVTTILNAAVWAVEHIAQAAAKAGIREAAGLAYDRLELIIAEERYRRSLALVGLLRPSYLSECLGRKCVSADREREAQAAHDAYWDARLNRKRQDGVGKHWRKFDEKHPPGGRPRLCIVFREPYGLFRLAYWIGATRQWWFLDSSDEIEVTHWCPVPIPPGGWPEPGRLYPSEPDDE